MKEIGPIKEFGLLLWLIPLGALVWALDRAANACKWGYKSFHALATVISVYILDVMDKNGL